MFTLVSSALQIKAEQKNSEAGMEKCKQLNSKRKLGNISNPVDIYSVQCGECFKWRLIPSQEEFEEIKSKIIEEPFICGKIPDISCDVPAEIEVDNTRIWALHKPNTPKTPAGFKRRVVMRKDLSRMDIYYDSPNGITLRAITDVPKFLEKYPEFKKDISVKDFCYTRPKVMKDTLPVNLPFKGPKTTLKVG